VARALPAPLEAAVRTTGVGTTWASRTVSPLLVEHPEPPREPGGRSRSPPAV